MRTQVFNVTTVTADPLAEGAVKMAVRRFMEDLDRLQATFRITVEEAKFGILAADQPEQWVDATMPNRL